MSTSERQAAADVTGQENHDLLQKSPTFPEENPTFATTMGPPMSPSVAKVEIVEDSRPNPWECLAKMLAALHAGDSPDQVMAFAIAREPATEYDGFGRPAALTQGAKKRLCVMLTLGYTRSLAAAQLGVARSTITRTMQRDEAFCRDVLQAEELYEQMPLLTIMQAAQKNWRAAAWLMRNHRPHESVSRRKKRHEARRSATETQDWFDACNAESEASRRGERKIQKKTKGKKDAG